MKKVLFVLVGIVLIIGIIAFLSSALNNNAPESGFKVVLEADK